MIFALTKGALSTGLKKREVSEGNAKDIEAQISSIMNNISIHSN